MDVVEPVVLDINAVIRETRAFDSSLDPDLAHVRIDAGYFVALLVGLAGGRVETGNAGSDVRIVFRDRSRASTSAHAIVRQAGGRIAQLGADLAVFLPAVDAPVEVFGDIAAVLPGAFDHHDELRARRARRRPGVRACHEW